LLSYLRLDVLGFEAFPEAEGRSWPSARGRSEAGGRDYNWGTAESFLKLTAPIGLGGFDACIVSAEIGCAVPKFGRS